MLTELWCGPPGAVSRQACLGGIDLRGHDNHSSSGWTTRIYLTSRHLRDQGPLLHARPHSTIQTCHCSQPCQLFACPRLSISQVLQRAHTSRFHVAIPDQPSQSNLTISMLRQHFWRPTLDQDTRDYVAACPICAYSKASHQVSTSVLRFLSRRWNWQCRTTFRIRNVFIAT